MKNIPDDAVSIIKNTLHIHFLSEWELGRVPVLQEQPCSSMTNTKDCVGSSMFYVSCQARSSPGRSLPMGCEPGRISSKFSSPKNKFWSTLQEETLFYFSILSIETDITKLLSYEDITKDNIAQKGRKKC